MRIRLKMKMLLCFSLLALYLPGCLNKHTQEFKQPLIPDTPQIQERAKTSTLRTFFKWKERPKVGVPLLNPYAERLHAFIEKGHLLQVTSPTDVRKHLGKPITKVVKKIKNKHEKNMDEWLTYTYPGVAFVFYHAVNHDRYFLFNIEITSEKQPIMYNLTVGKTKDVVINELGEQGNFEATRLEYFDMDEDYLPGLVRFYFSGPRVSKIVWIYPLD